MATGILLTLIGVWIVLRTVALGQNLSTLAKTFQGR
jgi:hypothetical protein